MTITTECKNCGCTFEWTRSVGVKGRYRRHCSIKCSVAWSAKNRKPKPPQMLSKSCVVCSESFETTLPGKKTCSAKCQKERFNAKARKLNNRIRAIKPCGECGKSFGVTVNKKHFCSKRCANRNGHKQRSPHITESSRLLSSKRMKQIAARRRKCTGCGHAYLQIGKKLLHKTLCKGCCDVAKERNSRRTCEDCGVVYTKEKYQSSKRCSACSDARRREVIRECKKRRGHRMRAKQKGGDLFVSRDIFKRDLWRCYLCGTKVRVYATKRNMPDEATIDHVVPVSKGGEHSLANCRCACRVCNTLKSDSMPERQLSQTEMSGFENASHSETGGRSRAGSNRRDIMTATLF